MRGVLGIYVGFVSYRLIGIKSSFGKQTSLNHETCSCLNLHRAILRAVISTQRTPVMVEKRGCVCWCVDRNFWNEVVFEDDSQRWSYWQGLVVLLVMKMLFSGIMLQTPRKEMWRSTRRQTKLEVMLRR